MKRAPSLADVVRQVVAVLIRYVTNWRDADSQEAAGLFMAAQSLRESDRLAHDDRHALRQLDRWFDENLERPTRLRRSRKPHRQNKAISWFRENATAHLARAEAMMALLAPYGVRFRAVHTCRPGYIVYQDEFQVVAEPFTDTDR